MKQFLALFAIFICLVLLSPYPITAFIAAVVAALTLPAYRFIRARMNNLGAVSVFCLFLSVCIIAPISIAIIMVVPQAMQGIRRITVWWQNGHEIPPIISHYAQEGYRLFIENIPQAAEYIDKLENDFNSIVNSGITFIVSKGLYLAGDTMNIAWALCLFVIFTCLFVVYSSSIRRAAILLLPNHEGMIDRFIAVLQSASRSVFIGLVFVPVVQGILTGIGVSFFDVPDPAFWGLLAVFVAVIPMVGTSLVWVPIAIYLGATQSLSSAIFLLLWGVIVISGSDSLLRPFLLKTGIKAPVFVLLTAIICSMAVFGAVGLIAGPLMVAFAKQAILESSGSFDKE